MPYDYGRSGPTKRLYSPEKPTDSFQKNAKAFEKGFNQGGSIKDVTGVGSRLWQAITSKSKDKARPQKRY